MPKAQKAVEPIVGFYIGGITPEHGVGAVMKAHFLNGGGELKIAPVWHPDHDPSTQHLRRKSQPALLSPPSDKPKKSAEETVTTALLSLDTTNPTPIKYADFVRTIIDQSGLSKAGVDYGFKKKCAKLAKIKDGEIIPNIKALNVLRASMNGGTHAE